MNVITVCAVFCHRTPVTVLSVLIAPVLVAVSLRYSPAISLPETTTVDDNEILRQLRRRRFSPLNRSTNSLYRPPKKETPNWVSLFLVDDNGLEPLTLRTSSECSTS